MITRECPSEKIQLMKHFLIESVEKITVSFKLIVKTAEIIWYIRILMTEVAYTFFTSLIQSNPAETKSAASYGKPIAE